MLLQSDKLGYLLGGIHQLRMMKAILSGPLKFDVYGDGSTNAAI
jgi:hypothetical protein